MPEGSSEQAQDGQEPSKAGGAILGPVEAIERILGQLELLMDRSYGRSEQELRNAHAIGKLTVTFGAAEARRRVLDLSSTKAPAPTGPSEGSQDSTAPREPAPDPSEVDRCIPGYDDLSASQVVLLLGELDDEGLAAVASHEGSGRGRRTILNRVAQLVDERSGS